MKTLQQLIPSLFEDYSESLSAITSKLGNLSKVSVKSSAFLNSLAATKVVNAELNASKSAANAFDWFSNINDVALTEDNKIYENDNPEDFEIFNQLTIYLRSKYNTNPDVGELPVIGYYKGIPLYLKVSDFTAEGTAVQLHTMQSMADKYPTPVFSYFITNSVNGWVVQYTNPNAAETGSQFTYYLNNYDENGDFVDVAYACTIDELCNEIFNSYISFDCLSNIAKRAQSDGNITRDQIESILNQYGKTDVTEAVRGYIAGLGVLDSTSILTIIGKVLSLTDASYTSGDKYEVYDRPNYITSIVQAVISVIVSVVAVILSAVFHAIGILISVVAAVVSRLVDMLKASIPSASGKILRASLVPVSNYPVATFDINKTEFNIMISNGRFTDYTFDDLLAYTHENGCAMIFPNNGLDLSPWYFWVLPKDESTLTFQVLISATLAQPTSILLTDSTYDSGSVISFGSVPSSGTPLCDITWNSTTYGRNCSYAYPYDYEYSYMNYINGNNDEKLRRALSTNFILFLQDILLKNSSYYHKELADFNVGGWEKNNDHTVVDPSKITFGSINTRLSYMSYTSTDKLFSYAILGSFPMSAMINLNFDTMTPSWEAMTTMFSVAADASSVIKTALVAINGVNNNASFDSNNLYQGYELASPAVEWPGISRSAVMTGLVISAISAAALAATAVVAKIGCKRVAFSRLALRQAQFSKAQSEYDQMYRDINTYGPTVHQYTKDDIDRISSNYYRANRRLTRAWNLASKLGLSMFNGFSTGSSSVASDISGTDTLLSSVQGVCANPYTSNIDTNFTSSAIYNMNQLYKAITGNEF